MQSEFVSSVSHELRTPLTAISGWSETLLSAGAGVDSAEARRGLSIIQREAARLTDMVEELLEFTRLQDGRFTLNVVPCDLRTEFEDTVFMYGSRLRQEGIRNRVSLVVGGSIRSSADVVKAIALGADAVYIATGALLALGCHLCRSCQTGRCNWGIATQIPELTQRLNPDMGCRRLVNLVSAWNHEIKEMMGGMGINSLEALRGNRAMLRGVGLNEKELSILGIRHAGE